MNRIYILSGFREDCLCRQRRHEWKFGRRSFSDNELMFAQAQLAEHVQLADKGWKFERRLLLNNELMSAETDKGCEYDII